MRMTADMLKRMKTARHLLPEPAPAVMGELLEEINRLREALADVVAMGKVWENPYEAVTIAERALEGTEK